METKSEFFLLGDSSLPCGQGMRAARCRPAAARLHCCEGAGASCWGSRRNSPPSQVWDAIEGTLRSSNEESQSGITALVFLNNR